MHMKKQGLYAVMSLGLILTTAVFAADRVVVCEEAYSEG